MRRDVARHRDYSDHCGALAHCALCQSPSALKLIGSSFICSECIRFQDWLGFSSFGGRVEAGRSAFSPRPRSTTKSTQLELFSYRLTPSDPSYEGESL